MNNNRIININIIKGPLLLLQHKYLIGSLGEIQCMNNKHVHVIHFTLRRKSFIIHDDPLMLHVKPVASSGGSMQTPESPKNNHKLIKNNKQKKTLDLMR